MNITSIIAFIYIGIYATSIIASPSIDVVIPCTEKDLPTLDLCIDGIRTYGKNIDRIIVISHHKLTEHAEWFDEAQYPFSFDDIAFHIFQNTYRARNYLSQSNNRIGWIFQQLLKLYSPFVIPHISENVLVLDADTIFVRPVEFIDSEGYALYNPGTEYHRPYFEHGAKLIPHFKKVYPSYSGISHHMLLQKNILNDLFDVVESYHKTSFWKAFCNCINHAHVAGSCASEYELYFNFIFSHNYQVKIRRLSWANVRRSLFEKKKNESYDYVSCHSYL